MFKYLIYLIFIVSVALAAIGIILAVRLRNRSRADIFSSLLYFLVFIFTFGFYGIWGQVVIKAYLQPLIQQDLIEKFSDISILLGLPFLVFAWLMLIRFAGNASGRKFTKWSLSGFLVINFTAIFLIGMLLTREISIKPIMMIRYYFILMNFIYSATSSALILLKSENKSFIHGYDRIKISTGIMISMLLQCILLYYFDADPLISAGFVFVFFAGNSFLPVYLTYGTLVSGVSEDASADPSLEGFCRKYDISPRETDIVREICNGLSNKEIANILFISLQTVKDHTHRIYIKVNVRSRVQLINLVKEEMTPHAP